MSVIQLAKTRVMPEPEHKIRLIYFKLKGRAEVSRLILAHAGVDFEDVRIEREEWPELKKSE